MAAVEETPPVTVLRKRRTTSGATESRRHEGAPCAGCFAHTLASRAAREFVHHQGVGVESRHRDELPAESHPRQLWDAAVHLLACR